MINDPGYLITDLFQSLLIKIHLPPWWLCIYFEMFPQKW